MKSVPMLQPPANDPRFATSRESQSQLRKRRVPAVTLTAGGKISHLSSVRPREPQQASSQSQNTAVDACRPSPTRAAGLQQPTQTKRPQPSADPQRRPVAVELPRKPAIECFVSPLTPPDLQCPRQRFQGRAPIDLFMIVHANEGHRKFDASHKRAVAPSGRPISGRCRPTSPFEYLPESWACLHMKVTREQGASFSRFVFR